MYILRFITLSFTLYHAYSRVSRVSLHSPIFKTFHGYLIANKSDETKVSFNLTLYPVCSRGGRGTLVVRHSTSHFPVNSEDIACWVVDSTPPFASTSERMKILPMPFPRVDIEPSTILITVICCAAKKRTGDKECYVTNFSDVIH